MNHHLRCVAVDNRGYGDSDKPCGMEHYSIDQLADDIANLAKALGRKKIILVGHDWGGNICYQVCQKYPDLVQNYIACNFPHPKSLAKELKNNRQQKMMSWYKFLFQCPVLPERLLRFGDIDTLDKCFDEFREDRKLSAEEIECYKYTFRDEGEMR